MIRQQLVWSLKTIAYNNDSVYHIFLFTLDNKNAQKKKKAKGNIDNQFENGQVFMNTFHTLKFADRAYRKVYSAVVPEKRMQFG